MSKIVVLGGAGEMGSMAVKDLTVNKRFTEIVIADMNIERANELVAEIGSEAVSALSVDITDQQSLVDLLEGATVTINFIGPYYKFARRIVQACIETQTNYVDICDDYDAAQVILDMDKLVKEAGITVLTGMGSSPGITNVLAKMGMEELDEVETVDTIWVMGKPELGSALLYHVFHGGTGYVPAYTNGEKTEIIPFTEAEAVTVEFPEPLGTVKVYDVGHPEPVTIPHFYPGVKQVTNKGALIPVEAVDNLKKFFELGLGSEEPLHINGVSITPRDFAVRFLQNNESLMPIHKSHGFGGLKVIVKGKKDGSDLGIMYTTVSSSSTAASVAIPAVVGAEMIAFGKMTKAGVIAPEVLDPKEVFTRMGDRKQVAEGAQELGLIVDLIHADGTIQSIRKGQSLG